jgi:DNA-directed RNA polymerase specialized sigma24 family protein
VLSCERDLVPSPELLTLRDERERTHWHAVARLPAGYRHLLWLLAYRPELTYSEIAAELGIGPGSVAPLRKRCLDRLPAFARRLRRRTRRACANG